jgi:hypothetical protein
VKVVSSKPATIATTFWEGSKMPVIAVTINGKPMKLGIDIASGMNAVTQAEAERLGLRTIEGEASFRGGGGNFAQGVRTQWRIGCKSAIPSFATSHFS